MQSSLVHLHIEANLVNGAEYDWIACLLRHCPPNEEMCTLIRKYHDWDISNVEPEDQKWVESVVKPDITTYLSVRFSLHCSAIY